MSTSEDVQLASEESRLEELGAQVIAHLNEKWGADPKCPMCGDVTWHLVPPMVLAPILEYKPSAFGSFPVFPLVCANCGNTLFVSGVLAGVFPPRSLDDAEDSDVQS